MRRLWLLALLGCSGDTGQLTTELSCEVRQSTVYPILRKLDLLLVIDRTPAMAELQVKLDRNLRDIGTLLSQKALIDLRIGVIAADVADDGALLSQPRIAGCAPPDGSFLLVRDHLSGRETNFAGTLGDALACIAVLGASGEPPAQPLEAMRRALSNPVNAGFVRDDAYLDVLIIASGDDASSDAVAAYRDFLLGVKRDPSLVIVGVAADPAAERLRAFEALFGRFGVFSSIRSSDFTDVVSPFVTWFDPFPLDRCVWIDVDATDVDPDAAGLQLGCSATERTFSPTTRTETSTVMPRCPGPQPCWRVEPNPDLCWGSPAQLQLIIERDDYPDLPTAFDLRCPAAACATSP